jgi:deoxyinosine 3'endonuclease (endonuclease V)
MDKWDKIQEQLSKKINIPKISNIKDSLISKPYVMGLDISFKKDSDIAVVTAVIMCFDSLEIVTEHSQVIKMSQPYIAGYLAFRELDGYILVFQNIIAKNISLLDKIAFIMIDGNGILHPKMMGIATHFGILVDIPTIGCGKQLYQIDGLNRKFIRNTMDRQKTDTYLLKGKSQKVYGWAVRKPGNCRLVYITPGHKVSIMETLDLVIPLMNTTQPEPTRQADLISRNYIRNMDSN